MSTERRFNEQETAYILEQAAAEPAANDDGVSLTIELGRAVADLGMGIGTMVMVCVIGLAFALSPVPMHAMQQWWLPTLFGAIGLALIARPVFTLPKWARTRASQMEQFAEKAERILNP